VKKNITNRGTEYIFNNKFSLNHTPKDNRKLTKFLKIKYSLINFFHINKWFEKKSWYRTMEWHWKTFEKKSEEIEQTHRRDSIMLSNEDIILEGIVIYDLLPKEYLSNYHNKYMKFKLLFAEESMFNKLEKDINDAFIKMENSRVVGCWFNLDYFTIKSDTSLSNDFHSISVQAIGLTESYYILKYTLEVTKKVQKNLCEILSEEVYKEPECICNGHWWQRNSFAGCYPYDLRNSAKIHTLNDYILELKSVFWNEVEKKLFSTFFDWKNIPPSIEIYSSHTLKENTENILKILSPNNKIDVEINLNQTVYFVPTTERHNKSRLNSSKIIASVEQFDGRYEDGIYEFLDVDECICKQLAEYFVLDALIDNISRKIYSAQMLINKNVYSKAKFNSLLKIKSTVDKDLYFYKRLFKELSPYIKHKTTKNYNIMLYKKMFKNLYQVQNPGSNSFPTFIDKHNSIFYVIKEKYSLITTIYEHFEENSKLVESRYNYKIVKWTLIVGFLTLLATILLANNSEILESILNWFCELFN